MSKALRESFSAFVGRKALVRRARSTRSIVFGVFVFVFVFVVFVGELWAGGPGRLDQLYGASQY